MQHLAPRRNPELSNSHLMALDEDSYCTFPENTARIACWYPVGYRRRLPMIVARLPQSGGSTNGSTYCSLPPSPPAYTPRPHSPAALPVAFYEPCRS